MLQFNIILQELNHKFVRQNFKPPEWWPPGSVTLVSPLHAWYSLTQCSVTAETVWIGSDTNHGLFWGTWLFACDCLCMCGKSCMDTFLFLFLIVEPLPLGGEVTEMVYTVLSLAVHPTWVDQTGSLWWSMRGSQSDCLSAIHLKWDFSMVDLNTSCACEEDLNSSYGLNHAQKSCADKRCLCIVNPQIWFVYIEREKLWEMLDCLGSVSYTHLTLPTRRWV